MKTLKVIFSLFLLGTIKVATAQYDNTPTPLPIPESSPPTGYFVFGFGFTQPMYRFASENYAGYGGYALPGNSFSLSLGAPIMHSNFGVALMYSYNWNKYDINGYVSNIQFSDQSNTYNPVSDDSYRESMIMGGLFATIPIQRLSIDFRAMGDVAMCTLPEVAYEMDATSVTA